MTTLAIWQASAVHSWASKGAHNKLFRIRLLCNIHTSMPKIRIELQCDLQFPSGITATGWCDSDRGGGGSIVEWHYNNSAVLHTTRHTQSRRHCRAHKQRGNCKEGADLPLGPTWLRFHDCPTKTLTWSIVRFNPVTGGTVACGAFARTIRSALLLQKM